MRRRRGNGENGWLLDPEWNGMISVGGLVVWSKYSPAQPKWLPFLHKIDKIRMACSVEFLLFSFGNCIYVLNDISKLMNIKHIHEFHIISLLLLHCSMDFLKF